MINYVVLLACWGYGFNSLHLGGLPAQSVAIVGGLLSILFLAAAIVLHRGFPKEHSKATDFVVLRTTGPYGHVRHPFYSCVIALNYSLSLTFLSLYGIIVSTLLLSIWLYLVKIEENDLLKQWGQKYVEYRKETPALFPRLIGKKKDSLNSSLAKD